MYNVNHRITNQVPTPKLVKDVVCETQKELADTLGVALGELVCRRDHDRPRPDVCLCQIDIEKTATKHGYTADVYYDAVADWKLVPNIEVRGCAHHETLNGENNHE